MDSGALLAAWGAPAEHAFHQAVANTVRNHCSKSLFDTAEGQMRATTLAQWPVLGAQPQLDPATEPYRLNLGPLAKRSEGMLPKGNAETQRLP